jgi:hypothetical protein
MRVCEALRPVFAELCFFILEAKGATTAATWDEMAVLEFKISLVSEFDLDSGFWEFIIHVNH